jgi:hypothetical protein
MIPNKLILLLVVFSLPIYLAMPVRAGGPITKQVILFSAPGGLTGTLGPLAGTYSVGSFSGSVGAPLSNLATSAGRDQIGAYVQESFSWVSGQKFIGKIRLYFNQRIARFFIETTQPLTGPTPEFPAFDSFPQGLHFLSYRDQRFSPHEFALAKTSTPWILFDNNANTVVLSPSSDFLVSQMDGDGKTMLASGLVPSLAALPAGFQHSSILVLGNGIESTIHRWGDALTAISGKTRPGDDSEPLLKYFGYWTDNGATYYYNYDLDKGYTGTLLAVQDEYRKENIPLGYLQLDSWWYQKSRTGPNGVSQGGPKNASLPVGTWNAYGGTLDYTASPDLFPNGLAAFQHQVNVPLAVHGRWVDRASPYHANYQISGIAPVDPKYWDDRAKYLADNGVVTYEQDWLDFIYQYSPQMATDIDTGASFTDNMSRATMANHETMQYCMAPPRFFLQGSKYKNLTTIRPSDDRFDRTKWDNFIYTTVLADSLHSRPWCDVFMSSELGNLIMATLSTGPVGVGDKIGSESPNNIWKVIRLDGVIVRPDTALMPTDATIIADAEQAHLPAIAVAYTNNGIRTAYVMAFTRKGSSSQISFTPQSLGFTGSVYVTSLSGAVVRLRANQSFIDMLPVSDDPSLSGWNFYTIAPISKSGITLLGDSDKFVGTGRARIPSIKDEPGHLVVDVAFASKEPSVSLEGFAPHQPIVKAIGATSDPVIYNPATDRFQVKLNRTAAQNVIPVVLSLARPSGALRR